jgi:hypothetical protein
VFKLYLVLEKVEENEGKWRKPGFFDLVIILFLVSSGERFKLHSSKSSFFNYFDYILKFCYLA